MKNRLDDGTVRILDMACLFLAMPVAWWARALLPGSDPVLARIEYAPFLAFTLLMWFVAAWFFQVYVSLRTRSVQEAFRNCQERGAAARVCLDLFEVDGARAELGDLDGLPTLSFSSAPTDEVALLFKRAFDVLSSAAALLLFSPVLLATALAVKLESPGPVFFRQVRVGKNGRPFRMFKFRSMRADAEERLESLRARNEASGPVFKMRNDPRVTRVGAFIRRYSIDELPQFLNVLSGEMSVVGPRPPVPAEVRQYERWQRRRLSVKPGITCTWQVSGRSDITFDRWMELDLAYIDSWSLWRDVQICFQTIPAVLTSRGAR